MRRRRHDDRGAVATVFALLLGGGVLLGLIEALSAAVAYRAKNSVAAAAGVTQSVMPWLIHGVGKR